VRLIALAASLVALAQPALAADLLPAPAPSLVAVAPSHNWTGCYVGATAGGLWSEQSWLNRTPGGAFYNQSLGSHDVESFIGGVQAGCDYQVAGGFLIGVQGDYGWTDVVGSTRARARLASPITAASTASAPSPAVSAMVGTVCSAT
jgi:outer membrane immunogenic protein